MSRCGCSTRAPGADPATFGEFTLTYRTGDILSPHVEVVEPIYRELEDFCQAIRTGSTPRSSAELGLEVVRTIEAVDASLANGGARVEVTTTAMGDLAGARDMSASAES